jgi:CMP-N-acetylneuraminic acid synthetase
MLVGGVPLYQIMTIKAKESNAFDKIVIDTDSNEIWEWGEANEFDMLRRLPNLAIDTASGNELLRHHVEQFPGYDYYWQGFVTAPFIKEKTIGFLESTLREQLEYDSLMTVKPIRGHFWSYKKDPLYRIDILPRSQDLPPIYQEISGFFGITARAFHKTKCRVGTRPGFYELSPVECNDIDWPSDLDAIKQKDPAKL